MKSEKKIWPIKNRIGQLKPMKVKIEKSFKRFCFSKARQNCLNMWFKLPSKLWKLICAMT